MSMITLPKKSINSSRLRRGKQILHEEGFLSFFKHTASFLAAFLKRSIFSYSKQYLYEERLDNDVSVPPCSLDSLTIKPIFIPTMTQLEYEDLGEEFFDFPSHPDAQENVPECGEAPDMGMLILYATANGEFVHRNAATLSGKGTLYEKLQRKIQPPFYSMDDKRTAYRALCVTDSKYRGKGVYTHIEFEMHNYMRKKGFSKLVCTVNPDMILDLKIFDKMGAEAKFKVYRLTLLRLFNFIRVRPCTESPLVELGISS